MKEEKRCVHCSQTEKEGLMFFQGLLSSLICSDCVRGLVDTLINRAIDQMVFKHPFQNERKEGE
jgi:hypothetical protein